MKWVLVYERITYVWFAQLNYELEVLGLIPQCVVQNGHFDVDQMLHNYKALVVHKQCSLNVYW